MHPWAWTPAVVGKCECARTSGSPIQPAFRTRWVTGLLRDTPWCPTSFSAPSMIQDEDRGHRDLGRPQKMRPSAVGAPGLSSAGPERCSPASGVLAKPRCPDAASDVPLAPRDAASPASTASRPADRDDREPPLPMRRDREDYSRSRKIVNVSGTPFFERVPPHTTCLCAAELQHFFETNYRYPLSFIVLINNTYACF